MENSNLIQDETLQAIADAIREVDGTKDEILVREYADRIKNLVETDILKLLEKYGDCAKLYSPTTVTGYDGKRYTGVWAADNINTAALYSYNSIGKQTKVTTPSELVTTLNRAEYKNFDIGHYTAIVCSGGGKKWENVPAPAGAVVKHISTPTYYTTMPFNWPYYYTPSGESQVLEKPKWYYDYGKMKIEITPKVITYKAANNSTSGFTGTNITYTAISSVKGADGNNYTYRINAGTQLNSHMGGDAYGVQGYEIVGEPGAVVAIYNDSTFKKNITIPAAGYYTDAESYDNLCLKVVSGPVYKLKIDWL